jgi:hypothetical protein
VTCGALGDVDDCAAISLGNGFRVPASLPPAVEAGKIAFDSGGAQGCIDAFADRSCDVTSESNRTLPDACFAALTGAQHDGAACAFDGECVSQTCDLGACTMACCQGTCVGDTAPAIAKVGESCDPGRCEATAYCDGDTGMCIARRGSGGACTLIDECKFGLDCDPTGTCGTLPKLGDSCTGACRDEGTTCSPTTRLCVEVATLGEPCVMSSDCSTFYVCDTTKHCSAGLALGASCTSAQRCAGPDAFCDVPLDADTGTCTLPKPIGGACVAGPNCESRTCDRQTGACIAAPVCI